MRNLHPRNAHQIRETLFDKPDSFDIKYTSEQKHFLNLAMFDFESICVQQETFKRHKYNNPDRETCPDYCIHFFRAVEEPIFLCNSDPHHLVASFIGALEKLASQSKAKMENLFPDIQTTKVKLGSI